MFNPKTIDRLIQGIQSITTESRSSLSGKEITLLKECITLLETVKSTDNPRDGNSLVIVSKVIEILFRVLLSDDIGKLKDLFF
jgi:hypothetical protein